MSVTISDVASKSICARKGFRAGDKLISINGNEINDVLDYRFYADEDVLKIRFSDHRGKICEKKIRNRSGIDSIGLGFETYLMDKQRHCKNACIFCFIDQLPKGMRASLYFKDDDSRLSFLFGNYITLTNLSEHDVERIIKMHISPINASIHTMDPDLRVAMMKNPNAGLSLRYLKRFSDAGIAVNAQLVLCPGINDGERLRYSLEQLSALESVQSIAAVPVGLTKYRDGLASLRPFTPEEACAVIDLIDGFNKEREQKGLFRMAYPSDEFFLLAHRTIPSVDYYGDFSQLDNGVGLLSLTELDFLAALDSSVPDNKERRSFVATGTAAFPLIRSLCERFDSRFVGSETTVFAVENRFFGEKVTVAGLITGRDLIDQLKGKIERNAVLFIPSVMLKGPEEPIFLDDVSIDMVASELGVEVRVSPASGDGLFQSLYRR